MWPPARTQAHVRDAAATVRPEDLNALDLPFSAAS